MIILLVLLISTTLLAQELDPATDQIVYFKKRTQGPIGIMTTSNGAAVPFSKASNSLNANFLYNEFLVESVNHVVQEKIPERVVHGKGAGAYGYFEVTHDISHICKADFLKKIGKKSRIIVRFSPTVSDRGSPDLVFSAQGFATRFFTKDGNFDLVGLNTPTYFYKDPLLFNPFVHGFKRNPATNLFDSKTQWDVITLNPESVHLFVLLFAGRAFPQSYGNMPGFGVSTYQVENEKGIKYFVRWHILPDAGIKNFTFAEARNVTATDPDYLTRNLYRRIANGECLSWTVYVQIATYNDVKKYGARLFDVTRVMSLKEFPLFPVGKLVLNENVKNYHAELEQLAYNPANLVRGVCGGLGSIFQSRLFAYRQAHGHRLGPNANKIEVNCPFQANTYNRDGNPPVKDNEKDRPNYFPNSFNGYIPYMDKEDCIIIDIIENSAVDNFDQVAELYNEFSSSEKEQAIENIASSILEITERLQERVIKILSTIHPGLGFGVAQAVNRTVIN